MIGAPLENSARTESTLIVVHDVNARDGEKKPSMVFACSCEDLDAAPSKECIAHGLLERTEKLAADKPENGADPPFGDEVSALLRSFSEGSPIRGNSLERLLPKAIEHLQAAAIGEVSAVPAPICVQLQISSTCSTQCRMCDHWRVERDGGKPDDLGPDEWRVLVNDLADFGVSTLVLSGGEPLEAPQNLAAVLEESATRGLEVGIITSGNSRMLAPGSDASLGIVDLIKEHAAWVSLSVDGVVEHDHKVRNPKKKLFEEENPPTSGRFDLLKRFADAIAGGPKITVTCTLQKDNIHTNMSDFTRFCRTELGASFVNFKFATGARETIADKDADRFLLSQEQIDGFVQFLDETEWRTEGDSSLPYLERCFRSGIFNAEDILDGAPLATYYSENPTQCLAVWLFALIDSNGDVYPCCHLYRDNHVFDKMSREYQQKNLLGNAVAESFRDIWNAQPYQDTRSRLEVISPNEHDGKPCGECTRYCQVNRSLSPVVELLKGDEANAVIAEAAELAKKFASDRVWI